MPSSAPTTRNWSAGLGMESEVSHVPWPKLGIPRLLLPPCPWPTPGDRVNPGDSSVDPQGAAIEDLGEAGAHLERRPEADEEAPGGGTGRGEPQAVRQKAVGRRSHAQTLTCTLGVGGSPRQDDLWEGRKESGPHPQPPISPTPPTAPPHLMIFPVLHGGPGSGEQRGAVRAWESCRCGSCRHRPAVNSGPGPPPASRGLPPRPRSLGLTWEAGLKVLSRRLSEGWLQERGPLDGSYGIIWGVQLLAGGSADPAQLLAGDPVTYPHPNCTRYRTVPHPHPPLPSSPYLEFQGWPDGQAPVGDKSEGDEV